MMEFIKVIISLALEVLRLKEHLYYLPHIFDLNAKKAGAQSPIGQHTRILKMKRYSANMQINPTLCKQNHDGPTKMMITSRLPGIARHQIQMLLPEIAETLTIGHMKKEKRIHLKP